MSSHNPTAASSTVIEPATTAASVMTIPGQNEKASDERCRSPGWWDWRSEHVTDIAEKLSTARHLADNGIEKRAVHAVISPDQTSLTRLSDVYAARDRAAEFAIEQGIRGGVLVFHGFRVTDDGEDAYVDAILDDAWNPPPNDRAVPDEVLDSLDPDRDVDGGVWWWLRKQATNWREHVEWSPHFHCLGLSVDVEENKPDQQNGWVCHRMRSLTPFALYEDDGYRDMVCTAKHLFTHASFTPEDTTHVTTTWFGDESEPDVAFLGDPESSTPVSQPTKTSINHNVTQFV